MVQLKHITAHIEAVAPPSLQESYDNSGLLIGNPDMEITGVLTCLDSTEDVIDEAIARGCNLVLAHHPVIWGGLKRITGNSMTERVVEKAIKNDIAVYACHTNLDKVVSGVNAKFASKLGLLNPKILKPEGRHLKKLVVFVPNDHAEAVREAMNLAGAGVIGNYDACSYAVQGTGTFRGNEESNPFAGEPGTLHREPEVRLEVIVPAYLLHQVVQRMVSAHPYEEVAYDIYPTENIHPGIGLGMIGELPVAMPVTGFLEHLKAAMGLQSIRFVNADPGRQIKRVAVCGGAGHFLLRDAMRQQADAYITSDVKYHEIMEAEDRILYADIGHYESERYTMQTLMEIISQKFTNIALLFSERNINPVQYFI